MWWSEGSECLFCVFYKKWVGMNCESFRFVCVIMCVGPEDSECLFVCFMRFVV